MPRNILDRIADNVLVCEGPMGSQLSAHGINLHNSAHADLAFPETVVHIHQSYRDAGAQVFQTNTFAANPYMLARAGMAAEGPAIWREGVRLLREAVGPDPLVAATGGPTGALMEPLGDLTREDVRQSVRVQFEVMLGPEVDFVLLEGFEALEEAEAAVAGVRDVDSDIPLAVTLSFSSPNGRTSMGVDGRAAAERLCELNVQIIGAACGRPDALEVAVRDMGGACGRPLMAQANAGVPEVLDGETVWRMSPVEAGQLAARLIGYGVRIVGGCCGCTPDHIRQIARATTASA
jgi:methionine synthase I (cobalamin-dependent)